VKTPLAAVIACLVLAGCGGFASGPGPGATTSATATAAPPPSAAAAPVHSQPPRKLRHPGDPWASPLAARLLIAFATQYINWNAHTVVADMRLLASESVGQAHSAMELAAGETARDYELQEGGIANSGTVEGISPLEGPGRRWVIVTRERTTAADNASYQGLEPAWHVIVASVVQLGPRLWKVSLWQPES
jgi:hypothetical protein